MAGSSVVLAVSFVLDTLGICNCCAADKSGSSGAGRLVPNFANHEDLAGRRGLNLLASLSIHSAVVRDDTETLLQDKHHQEGSQP